MEQSCCVGAFQINLEKKEGKKETLQSVRYIPVMTSDFQRGFVSWNLFAANESICFYKEAIRAEGLKLSPWDGPSQELIPLSSLSSTLHCHWEQREGGGTRRKQPRDEVKSISCMPCSPASIPARAGGAAKGDIPGALNTPRNEPGIPWITPGPARESIPALPLPREKNALEAFAGSDLRAGSGKATPGFGECSLSQEGFGMQRGGLE